MQIYKDIKQWTDEWLKLRWWVITWTKLKGVLWWPKAQETQIFELIWEEFAPLEPTFQNQAMQRWNELEPIAKAKFEDMTKIKIEEVWFIKSDEYKDDFGSWLWLSPDWIIATDFKQNKAWSFKYTEGIEIKCPWAKNHAKYIIENKLPDEYKPQAINYFLVMEDLEKLYFVTYNPDFYIKDKKLFIIEITREQLQKEIEKAKEKLLDFRKVWIEKIKVLTN